jgi:RimJ/RimL family protein N-acetyltransferase
MESQISGPAYRIVTDRLVIRCYHPIDVPLLVEAVNASLEHLQPWMPWVESEPELLQTKIDRLRRFRGEFDLGHDFIYGIFDSNESKLLGGTGLHTRGGEQAREIGYWIHADFINQGLATESSAALTKVAFEIEKVDRLEIHCAPDNIRSAAIPQKLGFQHEATLRRRLHNKGDEPRDTMIWSIFASEYPGSPGSTAKIQAYDAADRRLL